MRMKDKDLGKKQYNFINQMINSSGEINIAQMAKRTAWKKYRRSKGTDREQQNWKHFRWTRNRTKKLLKKKLEDHRKAAIKEIEELKTDNQRIYWKMLRELDGKKKKKKELWDTALNDEGIEVTGEKMKIAWK